MSQIDRVNNTTNPEITQSNLQEILDELRKSLKLQNELIDEYVKKVREAKQKVEAENPYAAAMELAKKEQEELTANIGNYKDIQDKRLQIDKWYSEEYNKLQENKMKMSEKNRQQAMSDLKGLYDQKHMQAEEEVWEERGSKIAEIVGSGFEDILIKYDDFGESMKKMATDITNYLAQEAIKGMLKQVFAAEQMQDIVGILSKGSKKGGFVGAASSMIKGMGKFFGLPSFHDGGVVPVGANAELPGTQEQLALLKGGERILSPSENTNYNSQSGGGSPVVFNNFNVKAWDSKDVSKYLLENRTLLNQITYQGIKDNDSQLRNMVRNA